MLNDLQLKVVKDLKIQGFTGGMTKILYLYGFQKNLIDRGKLPNSEPVRDCYKTADTQKSLLDKMYFEDLPNATVNPVKFEQEAWRLLSKKVKNHQDEFNNYILNYNRDNSGEDGVRLSNYLVGIYDLMFTKLLVISKSYGAKYDLVLDKGKPQYAFLTDEQWLVDVIPREQKVKNLILKLS